MTLQEQAENSYPNQPSQQMIHMLRLATTDPIFSSALESISDQDVHTILSIITPVIGGGIISSK